MTYKTAQDLIYEALLSRGWYGSRPDLKTRWVRKGPLDQDIKIWFKPQALYKGQHRPTSSLYIDAKELAEQSSEMIDKLLSYHLT